MKKYLLATTCLLFTVVISLAQSKDEKKYQERAAEVKQEIASDTDQAFMVKEIPDKFKNESAVVIARSFEVTNSTKKKFKFITMGPGRVTQYSYFTTIRERVLIMDKSALEEYSTLNYKKTVDKSVRVYFSKYKNIFNTYIGAKILKADGKIVEINPTEEEVLTKDENKAKEGKIAIPNLQVGDILDYYVRIEEVMEDQNATRGPDVFFLGDDYPILYLNVRYMLNKNCGVDVMSANGAKEIEETRNDDRDIILEFTEKNLPKISSTLWTSQARQIPYHVIRYGFPTVNGSSYGLMSKGNGVRRGPFTFTYKNNIRDMFYYYGQAGIDLSAKKSMEDYYGKKATKDLPVDSIVNYLYNYFHWQGYGSFTDMDVSNDRNYNSMEWLKLTVLFSETLHLYDIENDIILVGSRYGSKLADAFSLNDIQTMVRINSGAKYTWVCFNDFFQNAGQLTANYQGESAIKLSRLLKGKWPNYGVAEDISLPVMKSEENVSAENLKVDFDKNNMQLVNIERTCTSTGSMKTVDQKKLLLAEDVEAEFAAMLNKLAVTDKLAESKRTKEKAAESQAALDKERLKQKDYFKDDIKEQYDQEPKEMKSYNIISSGLSVKDPAFKYSQSFSMDNFVKKAGNNFIFDIGRLMGVYKKIEEKDRNRTLDVYMPSARQLLYQFNIAIPDGYTAKGVEALNKKVENDIASFTSVAKLDGNTVNVTITRTYKNNFEPATNWPNLLTVMDAAADFTSLKLLLEKKK